MANNRTSSLTISVIDEATKTAREIGEALQQTEQKVKAIAAEMGEGSGASDRFVQSLSRLKLGADDIKIIANEWKNYTTAAGIAGTETSALTRDQVAGIRNWESATLGSIRAVIKERNAETAGLRRAAAEQTEILTKQASEQATIQREAARAQKESRHLAAGIAGGVGGGILGAVVGGETLQAIREAAGQGFTVDDRIAQLRNTGTVSDADIEKSRAQYREFSKTHAGVSEADWLAARKDAATTAPDDTDLLTELSARYRSALRNSHLPVGEHDITSANRIMDEMALKTPAQREHFMDQLVKMQQRFGDTVPIGTYLSAIQNSKSAKFGWSQEFTDKYLPTLI